MATSLLDNASALINAPLSLLQEKLDNRRALNRHCARPCCCRPLAARSCVKRADPFCALSWRSELPKLVCTLCRQLRILSIAADASAWQRHPGNPPYIYRPHSMLYTRLYQMMYSAYTWLSSSVEHREESKASFKAQKEVSLLFCGCDLCLACVLGPAKLAVNSCTDITRCR